MTDEPKLFDDCVHCGAPGCSDEAEVEYHALDCPLITNIFPVDEFHKELVCPCCGTSFADEEFYTTTGVDPSHPAALDVADYVRDVYQDDDVSVVFAVCLGCGVTGREIPHA